MGRLAYFPAMPTPDSSTLAVAFAAAALLAFTGLPARAEAENPPLAPAARADVECWHADVALERQVGYCQVVRDGRHLHVSGVVAAGDMTTAVASVYQQLHAILDRQGKGPVRVLKETVFTTDIDAFKKAAEPRRRFYGDMLPAASWVQVQRLFLPEFVVEVELLAVLP